MFLIDSENVFILFKFQKTRQIQRGEVRTYLSMYKTFSLFVIVWTYIVTSPSFMLEKNSFMLCKW